MTQDVTTLVLGVDSSAVRKANKDLDTFADKGKRAETTAAGLSTAVKTLGAVVSVGAVAALAKQAIQTADAYTNMTARLSLVTKGSRDLAQVQRALFDVSQNTRADLEQTTGLYTSLARSTEALGVSQSELVDVTESINKALVISGTSAASAQAALVQLGQGFASGVLRGEELNSVLEQAPRLAQAIANGLGVPVGKLRELGTAGEITAEKLFRALQASGASLTAEFERMPATVGGATTRVSNSVLQLVGTLDKLSGTSATVAGWTTQVASGLDSINSRVQRSGGLLKGYFDALGEGWAQARLQATREELDRIAGSVKAAQEQLAQQPGNPYAKETLRQYGELTKAAREYEAEVARIRKADASTKDQPQAGAGRGFINPEFAGVAAEARERAALDARKAFLKEYASAEEKFTAELKRQKELQGDLFTAADEQRLRSKFFGAMKKAEPLDFLSSQTARIRRELDATTGAYSDAERVLEATRSAGLVREAEYYAQKLAFIEKTAAAQVASLEQENEAIRRRTSTGQQRIDDEAQIADNLASIDRIQKEAATSATVLGVEQTKAANSAKVAFDEAQRSAQSFLDTVARQNQREVAALSLGNVAGQRARERAAIEDRYLAQRQDAEGELRRKEIDEPQYQERLRVVAETQAKEIALWEKHSANIEAVNARWQTGASRALQNYMDSAKDVASQVADALSGGFKRAEDALVNFAMTGKGSFKDLANSIIADLLRIQVRAAMSSVLSQLFGSTGGGGVGSTGNAGWGDYNAYYDGLASAGGRAIGGPVSAGTMYQVNERGPELLNVGSKQYLMTGNQGGSVTPAAAASAPVTNINVAAGPSRNEVMTAIQLAVQASEARMGQRLAKHGF